MRHEPDGPLMARHRGDRFAISAILLLVLVVGACADDDRRAEMDTVERFFAAYNASDDAGAVALLAPDVVARDTWGSIDLVLELAWFTAQGAQLSAPSCAVDDTQPDEGVAITCDHGTLDAVVQAVDGPPVPTTTTFTVTADGISAIRFGYREPDFGHVGGEFATWLRQNHPGITCLAWYADDGTCADLSSPAERREDGRMVAFYAGEWAAYLRANGCTYLDRC